MIFGVILVQIWFVITVVGIDPNEKIGICIPGFDVKSDLFMTANEGVWFPQYRNRQTQNKRYTCHTLNEHLSYVDEKNGIEVDSFYSKDNEPVTEKYSQSYFQEKRGLLIDEEDLPGYGPYQVKNFIISLKPEYRVRYLCTNMSRARRKDGPVVYIETRNMTPSMDVIAKAVSDLKASGISVILDKIVQKDCTRPLTPDGYPEPEANKER